MRTIEELKAEVAATQLPQETKEVFYQVLDTSEMMHRCRKKSVCATNQI